MSPSSACSQLHSRCTKAICNSPRAIARPRSRQRRRLGALAHIDPDHAVALGGLVGLGLDLVLEVLMRRHVRHVDAVAVHVVFPAVIDAADAVLLVAAEKQRGAAMRAAVVHDADPARAVAERDQLFAEQHEPHRRAVALELRRHHRRDPILPHQLAHHRAGADAGQIFAVLLLAHRLPPDLSANVSPCCGCRHEGAGCAAQGENGPQIGVPRLEPEIRTPLAAFTVCDCIRAGSLEC